MKNTILISLCCFSLAIGGNLTANSGVWTSTAGGSWTTPANWTTTPAGAFPNAVGERAGFVAFPTAPVTITSTLPITIQYLDIDVVAPLIISFGGGNTLTFSGAAGQRADLNTSRSVVSFVNTPVILNSTLETFTGQASSLSIPSAISGPGSFVVSGVGSVSLSAANSFTGGTFVNQGTLVLLGAPAKTAIPGNLNITSNLGTALFIATDQIAHTGIVAINGGTMVLQGTSQIFSQLIMQNSASIIPSGPAGQLSSISLLGTGSVMQLGGCGILVPNITMPAAGTNIAIEYVTGGSQPAFFGSATQPVRIDLSGNTVDLLITRGDNDITDVDFMNTSFINGTLTKSRTGIVLFEGTGAIPSLTINQGSVRVGQSSLISNFLTATGPLLINSAGSLQGFGTVSIDGNAVTNSGTVEPGNSDLDTIGTLTILGNYTQTSTGILFIKAFTTGAGGVDQLTVSSGAVSLNGTLQLEALAGATFNPGDQIVVIDNSAGTGITGTFSTFLRNIPDNLCSSILYNPNQVLVLFAASTCPFTPAPPAPSLTNFVGFGNVQFAAINEHQLQLNRRMQFLRSRLSDYDEFYASRTSRGEALLLASSDPLIAFAAVTDSYDDQVDVSRFRNDPRCQPLSFYIAPLGSIGDVDTISSQNGFTFHSVGGLIGADYAFSKVGIGAQIGYERFDAHVDHNWGHFKIDTVFANAYATIAPFECIPLFLDLTASGGGNWYHIHRKIAEETAIGKPDGWEVDAYAGLGYDFYFKCNRWRITPLASVQYIHLHIDDFNEHGAGDQDSNVEHQGLNSVRSWLGSSFGAKFEFCSVTWLPEARGYWLHEFANTHHRAEVVSASFGSVGQVQVLGGKRNYGVVGGELRALFADNWSLETSYDYYWNPQISTHFLYGELSYSF